MGTNPTAGQPQQPQDDDLTAEQEAQAEQERQRQRAAEQAGEQQSGR